MRRNVILINCDDLGYGDLGCYNSQLNDTPTIDKLAREGVKFNSFYASSSVCTPSRASLLTGCYAQRVELPYVLFPGAEIGLNKDEYTLGTMFKSVGYNTMIIFTSDNGSLAKNGASNAPLQGAKFSSIILILYLCMILLTEVKCSRRFFNTFDK